MDQFLLNTGRSRIARGALTIGLGVPVPYAPLLLALMGLGAFPLLPMFWVVLLPVGFYVAGRGLARIIEGAAEIVRAGRD